MKSNPARLVSSYTDGSVKCKATEKGFDCNVSHTGGITDLKVCWDLELSCKNGKTSLAHACEEVAISGTKDHTITDSEIDPGKVCDSPKEYNVKNTALTVP